MLPSLPRVSVPPLLSTPSDLSAAFPRVISPLAEPRLRTPKEHASSPAQPEGALSEVLNFAASAAGEGVVLHSRQSTAANFPFPLQFRKEMVITLYLPM